MSARSSRHSFALALVIAAGCHKGPPKPQADPAKVKELAAALVEHTPAPAALPPCKAEELVAPAAVTFRTLRLLAAQTIPPAVPEQYDWANPAPLDTPAAHTLLDDTADTTAKREAAAQLLASPAWIVYRIDLVNAPMALGAKELKTGTMNGRIIRYDRKTTLPTCVYVWGFQNTREKTDWAISVSNKPYIDPAVMKVLQDDLVAQYLANVPRGGALPPRAATPHQ
jgi:hypothetical protein